MTCARAVQAFLVYMVYVYMAMAARESVLLLNGSNIRSWWIWHHYLAALTCIITLALPVDSHSLQSYVEGWLHWTILQALLMILQNMCAPTWCARCAAPRASGGGRHRQTRAMCVQVPAEAHVHAHSAGQELRHGRRGRREQRHARPAARAAAGSLSAAGLAGVHGRENDGADCAGRHQLRGLAGASSPCKESAIAATPPLVGVQIGLRGRRRFVGKNAATGALSAQAQAAWLVQEMERHETDLRALRGLFAVGSLLAGMGLLNAFNTIQTIVAKKRSSAALRQRSKGQ